MWACVVSGSPNWLGIIEPVNDGVKPIGSLDPRLVEPLVINKNYYYLDACDIIIKYNKLYSIYIKIFNKKI